MTSPHYRALRRAAGMLERSTRACLAVGGADRAAWLQGLLSNDVAALRPGAGCYATYLTPQGRLVADMDVFNLGERLLLDVEAGVGERLAAGLDDLIFTEDATIADWSATRTSFGVHGPAALEAAAAALERLGAGGAAPAGVRALAPHGCREVVAEGGEPIVVERTDELGAPGVAIIVARDRAAALHAALAAAGAVDVDPAAAETVRIESGRPRFPVDMDGDTIPLEAGIEERAISFTKGCYVGQEVIVRILHRGAGRVAKRLVGLALDPPEAGAATVPARRAGLWRDGKQVGHVTSAAASPALGRAIALGYVPRDLAAAGTRLEVDLPAGRGPCAVAGLPFVAPAASAHETGR